MAHNTLVGRWGLQLSVRAVGGVGWGYFVSSTTRRMYRHTDLVLSLSFFKPVLMPFLSDTGIITAASRVIWSKITISKWYLLSGWIVVCDSITDCRGHCSFTESFAIYKVCFGFHD